MRINPITTKIEGRRNQQSFRGANEVLAKIGDMASKHLSTPEQKLITATTALFLQPMIDLKYAQEDKKIDSAIKSASKAMAGGFTGVLIRNVFIKLTDTLIDFNKDNIVKKALLPSLAKEDFAQNAQEAISKLKGYNKNIGSILAIMFMVFFSNSKVDVPITSDLQDIISGVVKENKTWLKSICEVSKNRKNKIETTLKQCADIVKNKIKTEVKTNAQAS